MMKKTTYPFIAGLTLLCMGGVLMAQEPLKVCTTTPDIESLAKSLGGEAVEVYCFTSGPEDPHLVEPTQSMVAKLRDADLLITVGLGIEEAWLPDLVRRSGNAKLGADSGGTLDIGEGVEPLDVSEEGTLHEEGNPHYLLDPVEGLRAARRICDVYLQLRPEDEALIEGLHASFTAQWARAFLGPRLAQEADLELLEDFENHADVEAHLSGLLEDAGADDGVAGAMAALQGVPAVGDHDLWPYFARRYGIEILGYLEPSPGVAPTTGHMSDLLSKMKGNEARYILTAPYFDPRYARFVATRANGTIVRMSHQTGALPDEPDYLSMIKNNARRLLEALKAPNP